MLIVTVILEPINTDVIKKDIRVIHKYNIMSVSLYFAIYLATVYSQLNST